MAYYEVLTEKYKKTRDWNKPSVALWADPSAFDVRPPSTAHTHWNQRNKVTLTGRVEEWALKDAMI